MSERPYELVPDDFDQHRFCVGVIEAVLWAFACDQTGLARAVLIDRASAKDVFADGANVVRQDGRGRIDQLETQFYATLASCSAIVQQHERLRGEIVRTLGKEPINLRVDTRRSVDHMVRSRKTHALPGHRLSLTAVHHPRLAGDECCHRGPVDGFHHRRARSYWFRGWRRLPSSLTE